METLKIRALRSRSHNEPGAVTLQQPLLTPGATAKTQATLYHHTQTKHTTQQDTNPYSANSSHFSLIADRVTFYS